MAEFGSLGSAPGLFAWPTDVAFDPVGRPCVTDSGVADGGNNRGQCFTPDGELVGTWGSSGSLPGRFSDPEAIAFSARGVEVPGRQPLQPRLAGRLGLARPELGDRLGISSAQIRKDLSHFGEFGKQGTGYDINFLYEQLRTILKVNKMWDVVLVGAGNLGKAIADYGGFKGKGFAIVAIFDSVVAAVDAALRVQRQLAEQEVAGLRLKLRIGVHFGDVLIRDGAPVGNAVNLATRLQTLARPGTVCVSEGVYQQVRNKFEETFVDLGYRQLDKASGRVRAYLIVPRAIEPGRTRPQCRRLGLRNLPAVGRYYGIRIEMFI